jgi:SAM-dependent methyltransferase
VHDFVSPENHQPLSLAADGLALVGADGARYTIRDGIPDFVSATGDEEAPQGNQEFYRTRAHEYDLGNSVMFRMLLAEEEPVREDFAASLRLRPGARVLEVGCGTCRDTVHLLRRDATVYAGDLSSEMLAIGRQRLDDARTDFNRVRLFRGDAMRLPFANGFFDAAFHFGGPTCFRISPVRSRRWRAW